MEGTAMAGSKALVIFYKDCIEFEAMLAAQVIHEEGLTVDVATPDGLDYRGPSGIGLRATHSYADVDPATYRVVIVPGGDTKDALEDETLAELLATASDARATIGAICAGPLLLGKAGLLRGRRFTHGYGPDSSLPYWKDGTYVDQPVVVDDNIVTAKPQAYIDFANDHLYAAGLRASSSVEYLRESGTLSDDSRESEVDAVKAQYRGIWGGP
jgi:putative intracellular protease/amidase